MRKALSFRDFDWLLLLLVLAIATIGVLQIYSTTAHTVLASQYKKQIYWVALGCFLAIVASRLDYHIVLEHIPWIYVASVLALGVVLAAGRVSGGARRWLSMGPVTFQVSEIVKLVIMILVAAYFANRREKTVTWKDFAKLGALVGVPAVLVAKEPDLGTALTLVPIVAVGFFLGGMRARHLLSMLLLAGLALPIGLHFLKPYQRERLTAFMHPSQDTQRSGYQGSQAKIAIGSGGLWGKGLGNGTQSRLGFIPVSQADFIFASYAEEQGFVGTLLVFLLYLALFWRLLDGVQTAGDRAGAFLIAGFVAVLFFQAAVNIGMMIGFLPITGIPLPLMSEGGSSTMTTFLALGLVMSVRMRRFVN